MILAVCKEKQFSLYDLLFYNMHIPDVDMSTELGVTLLLTSELENKLVEKPNL